MVNGKIDQNMIKRLNLLILLFLLACQLVHGSLVDFYKKGTIKMIPAPGFGDGNDWDSLFYDTNKKMAAAPDGTIFVSNCMQNNISVFNPAGKFVKTFSQKGLGPGDTYFPGVLTILDDKYLTVGEYASTLRISLFDFSGKCFKVLKTEHSVFSPIALKNDKVAYFYFKYGAETKGPQEYEAKAIIKDVNAGVESVVYSITLQDKSLIWLREAIVLKLENNTGAMILSRTKEGNLLVGVSNTPDIRIFSPNGKLVNSFRISMPRIPVTGDYIDKYKDNYINFMEKGDASTKPSPAYEVKAVKRRSFKDQFDEYLPYYREILVDEDGNILIFKWTDCIGDCRDIFQVYSPEGKYICETVIDKGNFDFSIDRKSNNIVFTRKGIFGLFQIKNTEDVSLRIVKVKVD
jgi:hypothetical protein